MSDIIDVANDNAEQFLQEALKRRRATWLKISGYCYYCNEVVGSKLFCDVECRDSYDEERRLRAIAGD